MTFEIEIRIGDQTWSHYAQANTAAEAIEAARASLTRAWDRRWAAFTVC
jgi:hypothetical protein